MRLNNAERRRAQARSLQGIWEARKTTSSKRTTCVCNSNAGNLFSPSDVDTRVRRGSDPDFHRSRYVGARGCWALLGEGVGEGYRTGGERESGKRGRDAPSLMDMPGHVRNSERLMKIPQAPVAVREAADPRFE
jgi:hypothetical protein